MHNILIEFGIPMKLVRPIKMCPNATYNRVQVGKHLSDMFPIMNGFKKADALLPLLFNFALKHAIRRVQVNQEGLKLNQILVYADDVNILGGSVHTIKKNTKALIVAGMEIELEVNVGKTEHMVMYQDQNVGRSHNTKTNNCSFEKVEQLKYLEQP